VNQTAVEAGADLAGGVAYYGQAPESGQVAQIEAKMLLHYAGLDERINAGIPGYEEALKAAGVEYQVHIYEGANHAFNNDTASARYSKEAADLAWSRTVEFLKAALA
ncbi:MAG: dienelactone hydrolase family protein, partial [Pseudomonadota bacterium]|nr:dienelactone hydrolase family protein [Pseudomonadota bacterium]